jgi:uncharacterized protein
MVRNEPGRAEKRKTVMDVHSFQTASDFLQAAGADLYRHEAANGLMLGVCGQIIRNPDRFPPPVCFKTVQAGDGVLLAAIMTPPHNLQLSFLPGITETHTAALADSLAAEGWNIPGVIGPADVARAMIGILAAGSGKEYERKQELRLYELRSVGLPPPARGGLRPAGLADRDFLLDWWYDAQLEMFGKADRTETEQRVTFRLSDGAVFLWDDGRPVSMAVKTRPTENGISVGMVFTPPEFRRRGNATACVAELSRALLGEGRKFCSLYADLANPTSNSIYQKIGYRPVCDFEEFGFIESTK